jgi:two-component system CheB/CheR fusion protein
LPEILQKITKIPVLEISDDIKVLPNHIYVIPSNKILVATDGILMLKPRPAKNANERNLPIDIFFNSLAVIHQSHAIGVVLSGTANDGTKGLKSIKENGGITIAQDPDSADYAGMPNSAVNAGVVDFILSPEKIPGKILELTGITQGKERTNEEEIIQDEEIYRKIISLLRVHKGTDFTHYKKSTIRRRILRRMALNKNDSKEDYLKVLNESTIEKDALYQDILIPVTEFFRDSMVLNNLGKTVFPDIIKNSNRAKSIRIWVAGCSTGEEAYSIAICFQEYIEEFENGLSDRLQIFATDLSEPAITKARSGIYSKLEVDSVSSERLKTFFTRTHEGYQVNKRLREMCVFAVHNFLKDPPFGKMDLISCRNALIYMEPYLQKKALVTFHYSLRPDGFLLLGKSETTGSVSELFTPVEKADKIFLRKNVPNKFMLVKSERSEP